MGYGMDYGMDHRMARSQYHHSFVTPTTYHHLMFEDINTGKHPIILNWPDPSTNTHSLSLSITLPVPWLATTSHYKTFRQLAQMGMPILLRHLVIAFLSLYSLAVFSTARETSKRNFAT